MKTLKEGVKNIANSKVVTDGQPLKNFKTDRNCGVLKTCYPQRNELNNRERAKLLKIDRAAKQHYPCKTTLCMQNRKTAPRYRCLCLV